MTNEKLKTQSEEKTPIPKFPGETPQPEPKKEPKTSAESPATEKPKEKPKLVKKEEAIAHGLNLPISKKQSMYICDFIKNKSIDKAIQDLEKVTQFKIPVPFKGEIPHRKGKGMMSGRYPIKASKIFINLLKGLKGNVLLNQMDLDKTKITIASATWANRPARRNSRRAKRTYVLLKAKEFPIKEKKK